MSWGQYGVRPLGQGRRENLALGLSFLRASKNRVSLKVRCGPSRVLSFLRHPAETKIGY